MLPAVAIDTLEAYVVEQCAAEDVQVEILGIADTALAKGDQVHWQGDPCERRPTLRAEVLAGGAVVARYTVRPALEGTQRGTVTTVDLAAGDAVQWAVATVPLGVRTVPSPAGLVLRDLPAGTPLTTGTLRPAPDAAEGAAVTVVVRRGELQLSVPGTLLRDGTVGGMVRVRNDANRTALTGVLVAPDRVEIP